MSKAKELQKIIDQSRQEIERIARVPTMPAAPTLLANEQAKIFVAASQLAEISTRRIIFLTWFLALLTFALLMVEIRAVFFPKDAAANPLTIQTNQIQPIMVPAVTNK
jgi:hypothetical protein